MIPMTLSILRAKEGGWDYRLEAVETSAISFVSMRPFLTVEQARTAAAERLDNFNQKFARKVGKMIISTK